MSTLSDFTPLAKALLLRHSLRRTLPVALMGITLGLPMAGLAQAQEYDVDIAAQSLPGALKQLADQTNLQVLYSPDDVQGVRSSAVRGHLSAQAAAAGLLRGTGVRYSLDGNTLTLQSNDSSAAVTLDPSVINAKGQENPYGPVEGYIATRSTTATKTDTSLMETPQSISVITRDRMTAQGAQTVSDSLAYTAGVYSNVAGNNPTDNTIMVRGFQQINANAYTDGLRNNQVGYYSPETYGMERIEVLKGPASVMYGQGSPGGTLNFVSKRPTFSPHHEVGISGGSNDRAQAYMDIGDVLDEQKTLSYRLVALGRDANSSIDYIKDDRVYIAPSLTWAPNEDTSLTLLTSYQRNKNLFTSNLPYSLFDGSNPNGKLPRHRSLNEPGFDAEKAEQTSVGYELTHNLTDSWTFKQNFRYTHFTGYEHQLYRNSGVINGNTINRYYQLRDYENDNYAIDNQLVGKFATGELEHTLLMGTDYQHGKRSAFTQTGNAPSINIYNPDRSVVIDTSRYTSLLSTSEKNRQLGVYLQDQIKFGNWIASLGGRYDWASLDTRNRLQNTKQSTDAEDFTGRVGLGYLFDFGLFPYISYTESFLPTSGTTASGSQFEPETAKQYEIGVKYQPNGSQSYVTLSAFDLRRQNVLTTDVSNPSFSVQEGEVTSRGVELEGVFKPVEGLNVISSYSVTDVEVTKDNPNFAGISNKGKTPVRIPKHLASLWVDYTLQGGPLAGLGFGVGARYTGSTYGDAQNTFKVPDYTLVDAMVSYDFGKADRSLEGLKASVNVKNLTDKYYVAGCFATVGCLLGAERTVTADLTYKW
ncbi:TonB-dependent siderophore receptor [Pseudomonas sp. MWU13-3659]|uniref:TonB-dependent siderophore receptor n=1 Tax=Pseudomonas sp. MWU13-3659 TaxID=2986964 RepID=UPI002075C55F|nr:TonB-dependent siderophore receptor [Pseudomonas sp. MWU13-3659]